MPQAACLQGDNYFGFIQEIDNSSELDTLTQIMSAVFHQCVSNSLWMLLYRHQSQYSRAKSMGG